MIKKHALVILIGLTLLNSGCAKTPITSEQVLDSAVAQLKAFYENSVIADPNRAALVESKNKAIDADIVITKTDIISDWNEKCSDEEREAYNEYATCSIEVLTEANKNSTPVDSGAWETKCPITKVNNASAKCKPIMLQFAKYLHGLLL
jgi:hypothetical protein